MSELMDWFKRTQETRVLNTMRRHIMTKPSIVDDFEKAVEATVLMRPYILANQLFEAPEPTTASCGDTCDQIRIAIVRH